MKSRHLGIGGENKSEKKGNVFLRTGENEKSDNLFNLHLITRVRRVIQEKV